MFQSQKIPWQRYTKQPGMPIPPIMGPTISATASSRRAGPLTTPPPSVPAYRYLTSAFTDSPLLSHTSVQKLTSQGPSCTFWVLAECPSGEVIQAHRCSPRIWVKHSLLNCSEYGALSGTYRKLKAEGSHGPTGAHNWQRCTANACTCTGDSSISDAGSVAAQSRTCADIRRSSRRHRNNSNDCTQRKSRCKSSATCRSAAVKGTTTTADTTFEGVGAPAITLHAWCFYSRRANTNSGPYATSGTSTIFSSIGSTKAR